MLMNARKLARAWVQDRNRVEQDLQEAFELGRNGQPGGITPKDVEKHFRLKEMARTLILRNGESVGGDFIEEFFDPMNPRSERMQEALAGVDSSAFLGITGQILITRVLAAFNAEKFVASRLVETVSTKFNGEKWPGIGLPADPGKDVTLVKENQPYPSIGFNEEYVITPATDKYGLIIPVTKEAVYFDRTGLMLQRADYVGDILGLGKEKRLLGVMIGATNNYVEKRKGDTAAQSLNTFYSVADSSPRWINHLDNNPLNDYTAIRNAESLLSRITDPNTGEPIELDSELVFAPKAKAIDIERILTSSMLYEGTSSTQAAPLGRFTVSDNPIKVLNLKREYSRQLTKQLVAQLGMTTATAEGVWFYGDPRKAFAYMENWPITVVQAPPQSEAEFTQDVVYRFKASERGVATVSEPRAWQRHTSSATSSSIGV